MSSPALPPQAYPLDLVRTRLAAQTTQRYYTGIGHALRTIAAEEGLRGLYRGMGATLVQVRTAPCCVVLLPLLLLP